MPRSWEKRVCTECDGTFWSHIDASQQGVSGNSGKPRCRSCMNGTSFSKFSCIICLERIRVLARLPREPPCSDHCCLPCMRKYIISKVDEGCYHIRCPGEACKVLFNEQDLRKFLSASPLLRETPGDRKQCQETLQVLRARFAERHSAHLIEVLRSAKRPSSRPVSSNEVADISPETRGEAVTTELRSQQLGVTDSSDEQTTTPSSLSGLEAQGPMSSNESNSGSISSGGDRVEVLEEAFGSWALEACQACPSCNVIIRKEEGCDHITCPCSAHFCYGCGAPIENGGKVGCLCSANTRRREAGMAPAARLGQWLQSNRRIILYPEPSNEVDAEAAKSIE